MASDPLFFMLFAGSVCHSAMMCGFVGICSAVTQRKYQVLQFPACPPSVIPCFQPFSYSHVGNGKVPVTGHAAGQEFTWHRIIYTDWSTYRLVNGDILADIVGQTCMPQIYLYIHVQIYVLLFCSVFVQPIKATKQQRNWDHDIHLINFW